MRRKTRRERGQTLVLFAFALPMLFALLVLVVDGANLMVQRRSIQNAADAAALAAGQDLAAAQLASCDAACLATVRTNTAADAGEYSARNGGPSSLDQCDSSHTTNCYTWPYKGDNGRVEVRLKRSVSTFFASAVGVSSMFDVSARAVASTQAATQTKVTPGEPITTPVVSGPATAIFARASKCSGSFFIPGNNDHVTGVWTNGGIGKIGDAASGSPGTVIDGIRANEFWNSGANAGKCDDEGTGNTVKNKVWGPALDNWLISYPDLTSLFRASDSHCLYMSDTVTTKALQSNQATLTMSKSHCLSAGNTVTVTNVDSRLNGTYPVTGVTSDTFSFSKSLSTFSRNVTNKALQSGIATLTTSVAHGLFVGDIVTVNIGDNRFDGTYTVTAVPTTTTFKYAKTIPTANLTVTNKALAASVAALTTSAAHHLSVGDTVTVNINDNRFDGTYTVTTVPSTTTFKYSPTPVALNVISKKVTSNVATLTTSAAHNLKAGDVVTVDINDPRFDGLHTIMAVPSSTTFSYTPAVIKNTAWSKFGTTITMTTAAAHGLQVGNSITVSGFGGAQSCLNQTSVAVTAETSTTFSYVVPSACNPGTSGTQKGTITIVTVTSVAASGTATVVTVTSTTASGIVTVPGFVASAAASGTVTFTGNIASTPATGTVTSGTTGALTIGSGWTGTHPPGIYVVDTSTNDQLTISASNTTFDGYTFVAPEILVSGSGDTFNYDPSAIQQTVFYGYDPAITNAVEVSGTTTNNQITGGMYCGPEVASGGTEPGNKCWVGGTNQTFNGVMEGWVIEYTAKESTFNGSGPAIPVTTTYVVTTTPETTETVITGTTVGLGE